VANGHGNSKNVIFRVKIQIPFHDFFTSWYIEKPEDLMIVLNQNRLHDFSSPDVCNVVGAGVASYNFHSIASCLRKNTFGTSVSVRARA